LVYQIYKTVWYSEKVYGGYEIADIPIMDIYSKYFNKNVGKDEIETLVIGVKNLGLDFSDQFYKTGYWEEKINLYQRKLVLWDDKIPNKKGQVEDKIYKISEHFIKYMHQNKNISIYSANYYSRLLYSYFMRIIDSDKKPKKLFYFPKIQIDTTIAKISKDYMWINTTKAFSLLNTIYYFADYLFLCGNYSEQEKLEVQNSTLELFNTIYPSQMKQEIETRTFEKFPLFG